MTADVTVSDTRAIPAPSYYRPDVQGLRAIAVLMVVAYHACGYLPGGFVGVDVFFVISGFVIGQLLHRELEATGTIDFKRFYLRRIRRILPASAALLAVVLPLSAILAPIGGLDGAQRTGVESPHRGRFGGIASSLQLLDQCRRNVGGATAWSLRP